MGQGYFLYNDKKEIHTGAIGFDGTRAAGWHVNWKSVTGLNAVIHRYWIAHKHSIKVSK